MILPDQRVRSLRLVKTGQMEKAEAGRGRHRRRFHPEIADMSYVGDAFEIDDAESFEVARELLRKEEFLQLFNRHAPRRSMRYCRQQTEKKRVVTFVCDTGNKYLSKMYNDFWMAEQGSAIAVAWRLKRFDINRHEEGEVISVGPRHLAHGVNAKRFRECFAGAGSWMKMGVAIGSWMNPTCW